jgi:hypothetical protein
MLRHLATLGRLGRGRNRLAERVPARLLADMGLAEAPVAERRPPPLARWPLLPGAILRS